MSFAPYNDLRSHCAALGFGDEWTEAVCALGNERFAACPHGDYPRWKAALDGLPAVPPAFKMREGMPCLGENFQDVQGLADELMAFHPWRKGPLQLAGVTIDTEWRSDWKWSRIAPHVDLGGHRVLDIGCGNGYFGWRMLDAGAELVIGVDPTWVFVMQWLACRHFAGDLANFVLPLGIEDLPGQEVAFDSVFSMGVLYHRRDPAHHLARLHSLLKPGGTVVLETLVLPDDQAEEVLVPEGRYARMRNVWAVPGCERLLRWVAEAGFSNAQIVDVNQTTVEEQRSTAWMTFESLDKTLDPDDSTRTIEGHPAPRRAVLIARLA